MSDRSQLTEISIRSLGVIDNASIEFVAGLNVLTGETGAGKTMVLTALALILGGKADSDLVRVGSERLSASGRFEIGNTRSDELVNLLTEYQPGLEDGEILFARTVSSDGKSRASLSGESTTATILAQFGAELIEIHGQPANQRLMKAVKQRELLDRFAGKEFLDQLRSYQAVFTTHNDLAHGIHALKIARTERDKEISLLREFVTAFNDCKPIPDELRQIENDISRLGAVEELRIGVESASQLIAGNEGDVGDVGGARASLYGARRFLETVKGKDASLDVLIERFSEELLTIDDLTADFSRYLSHLAADPVTLSRAQERLAAIRSLIKKFGKGSDKYEAFDQLLLDGVAASSRISDLSGGDERVAEMERELAKIFSKLSLEGKILTVKRSEAATRLSDEITREARELSMPNAVVRIEIESKDSSALKNYTQTGLDEIIFLFTSHLGGELLPIAKAASGGELSRLMLAIEVVIAKDQPLGTYVFDEVDAGVGGKAAMEVGRRLAQLAKNAQVIVVTHLPQVAVWADNHLVVEKTETGSITQSDVKKVDGKERESEIARMLSGQESSLVALEHAKELIELVKKWR